VADIEPVDIAWRQRRLQSIRQRRLLREQLVG
jgi:hypothetical protein